MKRLIAIFLLAGCGSHTGVVRIADDTYMIGAQDYMGTSGSQVKAKLYGEANDYCAKQGKKLVLLNDNAVDHRVYSSSAGAEVQFRCK